MLKIGWGAIAAHAGFAINQVPVTTQDHLDRLALAACELAVLYDEEEEIELAGPGPIWVLMAITAALHAQGKVKKFSYNEPDGPTLRIF